MVEPIELHNMLGRTPLIEKTVAAQRDDIQQQANLAAQFNLQREHKHEKVELKHEGVRTEGKKEDSPQGKKENGGSHLNSPHEAEGTSVELVQENTDEPKHQLDITI